MPTKRTKLGPRRKLDVPAWVVRFVDEGIVPEHDTADHDQWVGWYFFREDVPGLPPADSDEGRLLVARERRR
jgi:hypothetical protein